MQTKWKDTETQLRIRQAFSTFPTSGNAGLLMIGPMDELTIAVNLERLASEVGRQLHNQQIKANELENLKQELGTCGDVLKRIVLGTV